MSPSITTEQEVKGNCVVGKEIFDHGIMNDCFREGDYFQNKTRFEYGFFHIPNRFNRGDIVRYKYDENYYMVLMSQEEYQNLFGYEIQASYLRTCYLDIDGLWKIKYLNPLFQILFVLHHIHSRTFQYIHSILTLPRCIADQIIT